MTAVAERIVRFIISNCRRGNGNAITIALIITYSISLIVAGHGAAPIIFFLFIGGYGDWWFTGQFLGWAGLICSFTGYVLQGEPRVKRALHMFSAALLYASWLYIACATHNESGSFATTFVFSVPFQVAFFIGIAMLASRIWSSRSSRRNTP